MTIFYTDDYDIVLWSRFLSREPVFGQLPPRFIKLPEMENEMMEILLKLKSSNIENMVLFAHDVEFTKKFLNSTRTAGLLRPNVNLLMTCLVS